MSSRSDYNRERWFANHEENKRKLRERRLKNKDRYGVVKREYELKNREAIKVARVLGISIKEARNGLSSTV